MRFKDNREHENYVNQAASETRLEGVFHGLDILSSTEWVVNRQVFDVVLRAWNEGEGIADIPASKDKAVYKYPPKPDPTDGDPRVRLAYNRELKLVINAQHKDHAERCKFNYNLEVARAFLHDAFYIPHNMDFRGRAYPIPPHLSPVGDDLCRGLLKFGQAKPLGEKGLEWLRIHMSNVYGFDKASFEERIQFAIDHEKDIFDSADRPLDVSRMPV